MSLVDAPDRQAAAPDVLEHFEQRQHGAASGVQSAAPVLARQRGGEQAGVREPAEFLGGKVVRLGVGRAPVQARRVRRAPVRDLGRAGHEVSVAG